MQEAIDGKPTTSAGYSLDALDAAQGALNKLRAVCFALASIDVQCIPDEATMNGAFVILLECEQDLTAFVDEVTRADKATA